VAIIAGLEKSCDENGANMAWSLMFNLVIIFGYPQFIIPNSLVYSLIWSLLGDLLVISRTVIEKREAIYGLLHSKFWKAVADLYLTRQ
jgi:hypothetical protein